MFNYANCFHHGWGTRKNYTKAFSIFKELADDFDYKSAYFYVGLYYQLGHFVRKDYEKARLYFDAGALNGDAFCINQLGVLYGKGLGVKKDYNYAFDCYSRAAELGDNLGYANMAYYYEKGLGVKKNISKAKKYYKIAADAGEEVAIEAMKRLTK